MAVSADWLAGAERSLAEGDLAGSAAAAQAVLRDDPHNLDATLLIGRVALAQGDHAQALTRFRQILDRFPDEPAAQNGLGETLLAAGQPEQALQAFERAVELRHDYEAAIINQGRTHIQLGQLEDAADCFHLALAFHETSLAARLELAGLARTAGDLQESLSQLDRASQDHPGVADIDFERGRTLAAMGEVSAAEAAYRRTLDLDPRHAGVCVNLGLLLLAHKGEAAAAEDLFRRALAIDRGLVAAQVNLGLALQEQGRIAEALDHFDGLMRSAPLPEFVWHRAVAALVAGHYAEGWDGYEARKAMPRGDRQFPYRSWGGESLRDEVLLVYAEQGVGDEIMFASCLPDVIRQAKQCVIECDERLAALFARSFPQARVHGARRDGKRDWLKQYPEITCQSAAGSLPRFLRRSFADFPEDCGYLIADPARTAVWQRKLAAGDPVCKVGLAWRGGTGRTRAALRSLPPASLSDLAAMHGVQAVSLQRGATDQELADLARAGGRASVRIDDTLADLDETAALVGALDLVITVDCTVAHLAGALGRPVWVLLPYSADWRYPWGRDTMPWYPSMRLFRQDADAAWEPVLRKVAAELAAVRARSA